MRQGGGSEEGYDDNEDYDDGGDSGTDEQFVRDAHAADLGAPATYVYGQLPPQGGEDADMTLHIQMQPSQPQPQLPQLRIVMAGRSAESLYMSAQDAAEAVSLRSRPRKCAAAGRLSAVVNHPVRALAHHLKLPWTAMADESVVIGLCGELVPGSEAFMFAPCRPLYACAAMPLDVVHGACAPYLQRVMDAVAEADREAAAWLNNRLTSELHALGMDVFAQTQALLCSQHPDDVREQWRWLHSQAKAGDTCRERPASLKSVAGAGAGEDGSVADQTWTAVQKELYNRTRARERVQSREEMIEATLEFAFPVTAIMAHAIESAVARGLSAGQREAQSIAGLMQTDPALRYSVARAKLSAGYWNPNISTIVADLMLFTVLHQRSQFMDSLKAGKPRSACRTVVALSAIIDLPQPSCKWVERTRNELYPRIDVPDIVEILQQPSHSITPADVNAARRFSTMADTITEEMTLMRQLVGLPERWEDHRRAAFDVVTMGDAQVRQFAGGDPRKRLQLMACWRWAVAMRFVSMLRQVEAIVERKLGVAAEQMSVPQDMLHKLNLAQQPQATSAAANRLPAQ